jgi:hypothetical protein
MRQRGTRSCSESRWERFFLAAERLGLAPAEVLMVGDDIEADVGGA